MRTKLLSDPKESMEGHLEALREYAWRVLREGQALIAQEQQDKANRLRDFLAIGGSFKLTERELVTLLYRHILDPRPGCRCAACEARKRALN